MGLGKESVIIGAIWSSFDKDINFIDELALMQHYDLPTRLLDVKENSLVALYFACCENNSVDGKVFWVTRDGYVDIFSSYDEANLKNRNDIAWVRISERQRVQQGCLYCFQMKNLKGIALNSPLLIGNVKIPLKKKIILMD